MTPSPPLQDQVAAAQDAWLAAALVAVDPAGLAGVSVRAPAGPVREAWTAAFRAALPPHTPVGRVPSGIEDERLLGGLDLTASLAAGRPVVQRGLAAAHDGGVLMLPMAERTPEPVAARLAAVLDRQVVEIERDGISAAFPARLGLVLLDEGAEPEERPPAALLDRLAFRVDLGGIGVRMDLPAGPGAEAVRAARARIEEVRPCADALLEALCQAAAALGVEGVRPVLLAARAARAHAALGGRTEIASEDAAAAVRLVLAPRALRLPEAEAEAEPKADAPPEAPPEPPSERPSNPEDGNAAEVQAAADALVEAARAALPSDLLSRIVAENARAARAPRRSGSGAAATSARRGAPAGSRPGRLRPGDRLNLPETLRAAAPWQRLRARADGSAAALIRVRPDDFRIRRFVQRREQTAIFVVDASGSSALQRLAEAKGAVELLLARAYVSRDRVALIAFRGQGAETLLAPTRSLTRAKRSLAELPGGGGTPLAAGLDAALALALAERARERTPLLVVLTDGRANVDRDGAGGRAEAERDALAAAVLIGRSGIRAAYLDTSPRPQPGGDRFARAMGAVYAPLPYAEAAGVARAVGALVSAA